MTSKEIKSSQFDDKVIVAGSDDGSYLHTQTSNIDIEEDEFIATACIIATHEYQLK